MKKIMLTGGHAGTTALAVIEALLEKHEASQIIWVGPRYALSGKKVETLEFKVFPGKGVRCISITTGKLQRKFSLRAFISLTKIPIGIFQAFFIIMRQRPSVVLSFGGYAAFPVILAAFFFGVPIVIHEQTNALGLANKFSMFFADKIAVAREDSLKFVPSNKAIYTGNPLTKEVLSVKPKKKQGKHAVIYITGGSRGSQILNSSVKLCLPALLKYFYVIHQTGELDYPMFEAFKKTLPDSLNKKYTAISFTNPLEMPSIYMKADILVGRSGANTVAETLALNLPSIFIPIPWVQNDEQTKNANLAVFSNNALLLKQHDLSGESLYSKILYIHKNYSKFVNNRSNVAEKDRNAAGEITALLDKYLL